MFPNKNNRCSDSMVNSLADSASIFSTQALLERKLSHPAMITTIKELLEDWHLLKMGLVVKVWIIVWLQRFNLLVEIHNWISCNPFTDSNTSAINFSHTNVIL